MTATEYVVLVDENDNQIGTAEKLLAHQNNLLHRAFSVFIFRSREKKELLLQKRALSKYHSRGLWTNACCSHPRVGEDIKSAGVRRLKEELGVTAELTVAGRFKYHSQLENGLSEHEMDYVLVGFIPPESIITPNPEEVEDYRWISLDALEQELQENSQFFTAWFAEALKFAKVCDLN